MEPLDDFVEAWRGAHGEDWFDQLAEASEGFDAHYDRGEDDRRFIAFVGDDGEVLVFENGVIVVDGTPPKGLPMPEDDR